MNKVDKNRPVSSIKHGYKRVAIPDSSHQGDSGWYLLKML
jgi:hypothetical protein